tara:strand:- start:175 stop:342 length:168 start_codon:yes stop_codon:yes gene_type:complete
MYFLFAGDTYYPAGGMNDLVGTFASIDEARAAAVSEGYDWYHIATLVAGRMRVVV